VLTVPSLLRREHNEACLPYLLVSGAAATVKLGGTAASLLGGKERALPRAEPAAKAAETVRLSGRRRPDRTPARLRHSSRRPAAFQPAAAPPQAVPRPPSHPTLAARSNQENSNPAIRAPNKRSPHASGTHLRLYSIILPCN